MSDWSPKISDLKKIFNQNFLNSLTFDFEAELTEDFLGTVPKDKEIYTSFVASKIEKLEGTDEEKKKILTAEEIETVEEELLEKGWTGFHRDDSGIFIYNYMILGNIKNNISLLNNNGSITKVTSYKKACDTCLKIYPRRIRFKRGKAVVKDPDASMERPIRAMTAKGERTFISKADIVKGGCTFNFQVQIIKNKNNLTPETVMRAIKLGEIYGLGQWRGSGNYGSYIVRNLAKAK